MTALFTIRYGLAARNVLRSGIYRRLRDAGVHIVIVCPAAGESYLQAELDAETALLPYPPVEWGAGEKGYASLANALLMDHPGVTRTLTVKWLHLLCQRRYLPFLGKGLSAAFRLHRSAPARRAAERGYRDWFRSPSVGALIDRVAPDLVVTTDLFSSESVFLREASRRRIPTACLVKSWDNLTSKGRIPVSPDRLIVWSDVMKREAVDLHFFPADSVVVAGAPNFDLFARREVRIRPREEFLASLGVPADRQLVVYSPGAKFTRSDDDNIRQVRRILDGFSPPPHLHIRKYPKASQDFAHLLAHDVTVEDAGTVVPSWVDRIDQRFDEIVHLGELMHHADVLIHLGSTIAIDAACFDTPTIGFGLDARRPGLPWAHYARRIFDLTHNRYLVDAEGLRVAWTVDELRALLQRYLTNRSADREGRQAIVESICGPFDGRVADRIAAVLVSAMAGSPPARPVKHTEAVPQPH